MATVRISQLTAITTPTDDDVFIINDADTNTRKISFANLTQGLLNTSSTAQTKTGALTIGGTLTASGNLVVDTNTFFVDATNNRVGVKTTSPATELDVDGTIRVRNANPIQFGDANDSNHVAVKSPAVVAANYTLTLPNALPSVTNLLAVNNAGSMEYSIGVIYNGTDDSLELGLVKLTNQGSVRFFEGTAGGSEYIQFNAPATLATTNTYTLPTAFPASSGFVLSANTSGILSWVSNSASAAGSSGEIQFNSGSGLGADADFVWNSGTNTLQTVNATLTGTLSVGGNVDLGDAITDTISFIGRADTDLIPIASATHDLGTSVLHWAEVHADDLYIYGTTAIDADLTPVGSQDIGSTSAQWTNAFVSGAYVENNVSSSFSRAGSGIASAASFTVIVGATATANSARVVVQARDTVTGDIEFYEHYITHDGASGISELTGSGVQAPTPGTFLTTPTTAVSGANIVLSITNSALSGNNIDVKTQIVATA
jgi:predicted RNA-binding protein with TRAM domain